ncbi:MAG: bifunctional UDP-N-acetylmuramoyl-tripeptide:D-alanyl-D-alanine ligase/alanine racemase [Bacteroidetes bacterium]|nr:bifunctional UDP-N-acetylmuramoyl-tripeptide:D-alanyl-D-alanine ligase/alanine racemase [Bacteroidota bacterium]
MVYTLKHIASIVNARVNGNAEQHVANLLTDSRQLGDPEGTLFIALITGNNDGHNYIFDLYERGCRHFLVQYIPEFKQLPADANFLVVNDTLAAFQQLVAHHRRQFNIPVIGITGSNGKTIVKEWLYQLLKHDHIICRSPKSYNSQIGVPLSVWQLDKTHTLGIFEAGISMPGEMERLKAIIQPTLGVLTNMGSAHDEGFSSREQKATEKFKLFSGCDTLIANLSGNNDLATLLPPAKRIIRVSDIPGTELYIERITVQAPHTTIEAKYGEQSLSLRIPFTDGASVQNASTCWAVMLALGYKQEAIASRMAELNPVALRLEIKQGVNNSTLINDFYNSDIHSLTIALHYLAQQHRGGKKVIILSDIEQSGKSDEVLYREVAQLLKQHHVDLLIGVGEHIAAHETVFEKGAVFYRDTAHLLAQARHLLPLLMNSTVLLKGSRRFGFEAISNVLQQKSHDTVLEINLNNLIHNINFYRAQLQKGVKMMCMVKATGYGSGSSEIAFTLQHHGVDYLAVAYADEGVELRKSGIHLPIMVMNPEENAFEDIINYNLEPEIFSLAVLQGFVKALQNQAIPEGYPVHIKLDTGMHRLGFEEQQIDLLIEALGRERSVHVKSVFSHLAASDDASYDGFTREQIRLFESMTQKLQTSLGYSFIKHICNSGAITRFRDAQYNMVRLGIGMYGIGFNDLEKKSLLNVSALKTRISQIKHLHAGDTVGYSRNGKINADTTIATIPIGYADGLSRRTGNGHFSVYIAGTLCKTVGNICMDMCMIDVTGVDCHEGDEVIIFKSNDDLSRLSMAVETIPYEVLTSVSTRVKRVYVQE